MKKAIAISNLENLKERGAILNEEVLKGYLKDIEKSTKNNIEVVDIKEESFFEKIMKRLRWDI